MIRELIEYSPLHGRWTYLEIDPSNPDEVTLVDEFDMAHVKNVMDQNARLRSAGMGKGEYGYLAASVPAAVEHIWKTEHGIDVDNPDHADGVTRLLNDGDYKKLRIWEGKL